ncbi:hypothetical protein IEQ34_021090 [Dendrobium chrysotoxum]|uniref:Uncharacterized protein n=1 Tax=Dendrobium chrysotoxum TaxID=161865 RepID=A0AAV7G3V8_DENCH|nr:hypothetical protein IEQ34_021090 [Dendrobium chrysotoxum]
MKREGRQHGVLMVRSPSLHLTDCSATFDTGRFYAKAPSKPGSHSKQTGKCRRPRCTECHSLPASKSKDKAKGAHKLRSCNVKLNHKLVSWRVVNGGQWPKFASASASDLLSQLSGCYWNEEDDDHEDEVQESGDQFHECVDFDGGGCSDGKEDEEDMKEDEDMDDDMGFCQVGFIMEYLERDDWYMVYEI